MKTVIEMAREAGIRDCTCNGTFGCLERFAELVRADERRAMMQLFTDPENQPTQHGTVTVEYMQREIAAEREAMVALAAKQGWAMKNEDPFEDAVREIAAIRARSVS